MNIMYDNFFKEVKILLIIIYARLSKEEQGKSKEEQSQSINNQIEICKEFIEEEMQEYPDIQFKIVAELYDDGITGTTFNRDSFNKAIKMLETKQATMLITKDLSRFGREHIDADNYIERWFPEHNIRYVAILDDVDTYMPDNTNNDMTPMKNWMNEMLAKNTSRSVKRTFKTKMRNGIWTGGEPPLGLQHHPTEKGVLIIEPVGNEIVKRTFKLAKEGNNLEEISRIYTEEKVPIPTVVKGNKRNMNLDIIDVWSPETIKRILTNKMYLGYMVQGKTTTLSHKSNKIIYLDEKDWIVVPNKVPQTIDQETFDIVQGLLKTNKNKTLKSHDYLLKGLIKCKECNHAIGIQHFSDRKGANNYTTCNYYRKYGKKKDVCTAHRQRYDELEKLVLKNIKQECLQYVDSTNFAEKLKNESESKQLQTDIKLKIDKCERTISKLNNQIDIIYNDRLEGIISEEEYLRRSESKHEAIETEKNNLERYKKDLEDVKNKNIVEPNYTKIVKEFLALKKPTKILITQLIDVIYLSEDGTIDIHYKVKNPYKK